VAVHLNTMISHCSLIKMINGVSLVTDEVVEAIGRVRVDQAVTDPLRRLDTASGI
jgi:hypothetical protein